ncbi:BTAD domain-containing putative transcriptional regulator [Nocardioides ganghwensis]|jgi:DNA-binding SARP family transcriptional activator|uniref:FHA domain-containing protein n=1 Tax=Nocardioides ganghwensis TaxID=252230 RepID=A0A4Q2SC19_9ACTN|nr:BTAD domain-containing putative transcriptional regulator [Nocardioides ganghwensis]MBD3945607.1 FHA domain-containing protein [Nocardioides ganghwensis]RYB99640.1 FHA domain-containing protein [Nocardioides ganghwensis]
MSNEGEGRVRVELLGPLQVTVDGRLVAAGGPKLRAIAAVLGLAGGRVVSVDELLAAVWGEDLPATARNTLQYHVGVLRKTLAAQGAAGCLTTRDPGYSLSADTDVAEFKAHIAAGSRGAALGDHTTAAEQYAAALSLWRGNALADLWQFPFAEGRAVALESCRLTCAEAWSDAELALGRSEDLIAPLQDLIAENPTRERLWEQLMVALYRTGRQDAALSSYRTARKVLDDELGVQPSARLNRIHEAVLRQESWLWPERAEPTGGGAGHTVVPTRLATSEPQDAPPTLVAHGGQRIVLAGSPVVLGRQADCDLVLQDDQASRRHAQVEPGPHGFVLVDLGSTNGTLLNGQPIAGPASLKPGDRILVGDTVVRFIGAG